MSAYHGITFEELTLPVGTKTIDPRLRRVTSRQNAILKDMRASFRRAEPADGGFCATEGVKNIEEAIRSGLKFQAVVFSDSAAQNADRVLGQLRANVEKVVVDDETFRSVVETESPQGVAALVQFKSFTIEDALFGDAPLVVVVAGVQDPGNLGTIVRSAEAFGASGVLLAEGTVSRFNPKVVRASAGSVFRLPCVASKFAGMLEPLRTRKMRLVGTSSHQGKPASEMDLRHGLALLIGNEGSGLSPAIMKSLDEFVSIPHKSGVESLNAGMAASILLYEASRQRALFT
jgi:RNA methyltransferase, TrmH family